MTAADPAGETFFNQAAELLKHLSDPIWSPHHSEAFGLLADALAERRAHVERLEKSMREASAKHQRMSKAAGVTVEPIDLPDFEAFANALGGLESALRKRLAEPRPGPGPQCHGVPLHFIGRAILRPDDARH